METDFPENLILSIELEKFIAQAKKFCLWFCGVMTMKGKQKQACKCEKFFLLSLSRWDTKLNEMKKILVLMNFKWKNQEDALKQQEKQKKDLRVIYAMFVSCDIPAWTIKWTRRKKQWFPFRQFHHTRFAETCVDFYRVWNDFLASCFDKTRSFTLFVLNWEILISKRIIKWCVKLTQAYEKGGIQQLSKQKLRKIRLFYFFITISKRYYHSLINWPLHFRKLLIFVKFFNISSAKCYRSFFNILQN